MTLPSLHPLSLESKRMMATSYSITINSFIAAGSENYTILKEGKYRVICANDFDALIEFISAQPQPFNALIEGRITRLN